jgi:hypothetical protein
VVQGHHARNEGLARMHMDHAVAIDGGIMHLKVAWWSNSGDQDRCTAHGWTSAPDLSIMRSSEHHERGAGAPRTQRGTCQDAYGSRSDN